MSLPVGNELYFSNTHQGPPLLPSYAVPSLLETPSTSFASLCTFRGFPSSTERCLLCYLQPLPPAPSVCFLSAIPPRSPNTSFCCVPFLFQRTTLGGFCRKPSGTACTR